MARPVSGAQKNASWRDGEGDEPAHQADAGLAL